MERHENNVAFLVAAAWWLELRLRLELSKREPPPAPAEPEPRGPIWAWLTGWRKPPPALPAPAGRPESPERAAHAALQEMHAARAADPPPDFTRIKAAFPELTPYEEHLLLLAVVAERDATVAGLCARLNGSAAQACATFGMADQVFQGDPYLTGSSLATLPHRPLMYYRLVDVVQPGPIADATVRADDHVLRFVEGQPEQAGRVCREIAPYVTPVDPAEGGPLPDSHGHAAGQLRHALRGAVRGEPVPLVQLAGADPSGKLAVAAAAAWQARDATLFRLPAQLIPPQREDGETFARLWERDARLQNLVLYLDCHEADGTGPTEAATAVARLLALLGPGVPCLLAARDPWPRVGRESLTVIVDKPLAEEQQRLWDAALQEDPPAAPPRDAARLAERLSGQFNLDAATIRRIAAATEPPRPAPPGDGEASRLGVSDEPDLPEARDAGDVTAAGAGALDRRMWEACKQAARPRIEGLAQRVKGSARWCDLIVPKPQLRLLYTIARQVRDRSRVYHRWGFARRLNRGLGIAALFAGESGTGKTMAAEVIANYLEMDLYRVDLSAVVDKYIGETEKHLRRLFDAAEDGGGILLFDECDSLFAQRTQIKDSHDRYGNLEINYLLQRIEAYRGLAVLTTNMKSALDPAFMRRLRFVVEFPFPSAEDRVRIWKRVFRTTSADGTEQDRAAADVDYERLARLNLTGGSIQGVALNAAFLAARRGPDALITMDDVLAAAHDEHVKLDKPISKAEFKPRNAAADTNSAEASRKGAA